jgi:hypothetical protein
MIQNQSKYYSQWIPKSWNVPLGDVILKEQLESEAH